MKTMESMFRWLTVRVVNPTARQAPMASVASANSGQITSVNTITQQRDPDCVERGLGWGRTLLPPPGSSPARGAHKGRFF
jgi:hypothetical protein